MQPSRLVLAVALAAPASVAQGFGPAPEMARFDAVIGHWEGAGHWRAEGQDEAVAWTCRTEVKPILDGHWIEERSIVRFEDSDLPAHGAYALYGWDRERGEYVSFVASESGVVRKSADWLDEGTFALASALNGPDGLVADREVWTFEGEGFRVTVHRSAGTGTPFIHVDGVLQKSEAESAAAHEAAAHTGEASEAMQPLVPTLGSWRLAGSVKPMPGMTMPVAAREDNTLLCGGHVVHSLVTGDPSPLGPAYGAVGLMAWDERLNAWRHAMVDSMGGCTWGVCHPGTGGDLVFISSGRYFGMPHAERSLLDIEDGSLVSIVSQRLLAASDPETSFEATYERIE